MSKLSFQSKLLLKKYSLFILGICYFATQDLSDGLSYLDSISDVFYNLIFPLSSYIVYVIYTFDLMSIYDKNYMQFIRFNNKKEYLEKLLKFCSKKLIFAFIIFSIALTIFVSIDFFISGEVPFSINLISILELLYSFSKVFILINLFLQIGVLLTKCFSKIIAAIFLILIQVLNYGWIYDLTIVDSFNKIHLFYGYYLNVFEYSIIFLVKCIN